MAGNKKIGIVAPEVFPLPPIRGGAVEHWIYNVAKILEDRDYLVLSIEDSELPLEEKENNIEFKRYSLSFLDRILLLTYKLPFKNSRSFLYWRLYALWAAKELKKQEIKVIHVHNRWQFIPIIRKHNPDAQILLHFHQLSALNFNEVQGGILKETVDGYIGCSHFMNAEIIERLRIDNRKVHLVYNGVFEDVFLPLSADEKKKLRKQHGYENERIILFAGRLVENKGAKIIVKAFQQLHDRDLNLWIVGGGVSNDNRESEYIKELHKMAGTSGKRIKFLGYLKQKELVKFYQMADIFVFPSQVKEALGMSLIEAMSAGLAVMGSDRGGVKELIDHTENGVLIQDYANSNAWAENMRLLLKNESQCSDFKRNAREKILEKFTWGKAAHSLANVYHKFFMLAG